MALLTTGEFYEVTWVAANDAAWAALSPVPDIPGTVAEQIFTAATKVIYVIDSASGQFAFVGGSAVGFDDSVVDASVGPLPKITFNPTSAPTTIWGGTVAGLFYAYFSSTDLVFPVDGAEAAAFKKFL